MHAKNLNKMFAKWIQLQIKNIIHHNKKYHLLGVAGGVQHVQINKLKGIMKETGLNGVFKYSYHITGSTQSMSYQIETPGVRYGLPPLELLASEIP